MKTIGIILLACVVGIFADDLTLEEKAVGSEVVEAVIDILDQSCVFTDDRQMLRRIAKLETNDGEADDTFVRNDEDYYGGIWRVSEVMLGVAQARVDLYPTVLETFDIDMSKVEYRDLLKPLYSGLIARIFIDTTPLTALPGASVAWNETAQAVYWATDYHHFTTEPDYLRYLTIIGELDSGTCEISRADLVFVLDGSGSIEAPNFQTMLQFVEEVVDVFDIEEDAVRVGVIKYSSKSATEFSLGDINDKTLLKTEIQRIVYEEGGTNTAAALDDMMKMFEDKPRSSGVPKIGIVMTDGKSNDVPATEAAAALVHDEKLTVFAVGVGSGVLTDELNTIGSDPDCIHVHLLDSFADISPFKSKIQAQACKAPAELDPDEEFDGAVETGKRVFFKLKLKKNKNGATIKLKMRSGSGRLYVSFKARNPGRAIFKYQLRIDSSMREGGKMHIKFPTDDLPTTTESIEAFVALMGEGVGQTNSYNIGMNDGGINGAGALKPAGVMLMMFVAALLALLN